MGLTIGVLAEAAGVKVATVRYYERRGIIAAPPRTPGAGGVSAALASALWCAGPLIAVAAGVSGAGLAASVRGSPFHISGSS